MNSELIAKIKSNQYDVISFDIWDTLIQRPFIEPVHLFFLIENLYNEPNFGQKRISAEIYARQRLITPDADDITYADIYDYLPKNWQYLKNIETELEIKYAKARPDILEIYQLAQAQGKKILIASDMYLPNDVIEQILHNNGYIGYDKLYLSSELKKSKYSGTMYELIKSDYPNANILHIGDNKPADFDMANQHGFHGFHIQKTFDLVQHDRSEQEFIDYVCHKNQATFSVIYRLINDYKLQSNNLNLPESSKNIALNYYAPLATYYCIYLISLLENKNNPLQKVHFATRDCNIMQIIFDNLVAGKYKSNIFYTSRYLLSKYDPNNIRTLIVAELRGKKGAYEKIIELLNPDLYQQLKNIIQQVMATTKETHRWLISGEIFQAFAKLSAYQEIVKAEQEKIRQYIELSKINSPENLIVDVGWGGGAQNSLNQVQLNLQTSFAYLLKVDYDSSLPNTYSLINAKNEHDNDLQYQFVKQIESMFTHHSEMVRDYYVENGQLKFTFMPAVPGEQVLREQAKNTELIITDLMQWLKTQPLFNDILSDLSKQNNLQINPTDKEEILKIINQYPVNSKVLHNTI